MYHSFCKSKADAHCPRLCPHAFLYSVQNCTGCSQLPYPNACELCGVLKVSFRRHVSKAHCSLEIQVLDVFPPEIQVLDVPPRSSQLDGES